MPFFYSTDLKSQTLDPSSDITNQKSTFRFNEDTAYYPNIRLANLGCFGSVSHSYNSVAGVYGVIRHVRLTSNGVELDSMRFANRYLAWRNLTGTNRDNVALNRNIIKNQVGYEVLPTGHAVSASITADQQTGTARDEARLGGLDLRRCLPLLENISILDTAVFKNLVLEVEWETDARRMVVVDNVPQTIQTPMLIVEEITKPQLRQSLTQNFAGAVWNKVEHDIVNIDAIADPAGAGDTTEVNSVNQMNAFDDKFVSRIVIMKTFNDKNKYVTTNVVQGFGDFGSLCPHKEKIQIKLNGANIFPAPLEHPSTKDMITYDTWGKVNIPPYGSVESVGNDTDGSTQVNLSGAVSPKDADNKQRGLTGGAGFFGCSINSKVGNLSLDYTRTAVNNASTSRPDQQALDIHAYAECRKSLVVSKGTFNVAYV